MKLQEELTPESEVRGGSRREWPRLVTVGAVHSLTADEVNPEGEFRD